MHRTLFFLFCFFKCTSMLSTAGKTNFYFTVEPFENTQKYLECRANPAAAWVAVWASALRSAFVLSGFLSRGRIWTSARSALMPALQLGQSALLLLRRRRFPKGSAWNCVCNLMAHKWAESTSFHPTFFFGSSDGNKTPSPRCLYARSQFPIYGSANSLSTNWHIGDFFLLFFFLPGVQKNGSWFWIWHSTCDICW